MRDAGHGDAIRQSWPDQTSGVFVISSSLLEPQPARLHTNPFKQVKSWLLLGGP